MLLDYSFRANTSLKIPCPGLFLRQNGFWSKPTNLTCMNFIPFVQTFFALLDHFKQSNWVRESIPHPGPSHLDATPWVGTHPVCPNFGLPCLFHKTTSFNHVGWNQEIDTHQEGRACLLCRDILPNFNMKKTQWERKHKALEKNNNHHVEAKWKRVV